MSSPFKMQLKGDKEMIRLIEQMERQVNRRGIRKAVGRGAKEAVSTIRSEAPVDTGALKKSVGSKVRAYRHTKSTVAAVGPRADYEKDGRKPNKYAHLVEFGTVDTMGDAFMRKGLNKSKTKVRNKIVSTLREEIEKHKAK